MVLIIAQEIQKYVPESTKILFDVFPIYAENAKNFLSKGITNVTSKGLLYVHQREYAATVPEDVNVDIIGSDDATTCIVIIVRHSVSGATALAHLDGQHTNDIIMKMVQRVQELSTGFSEGILEIQIVGGYCDEKHYSAKLVYDIMITLQSHPLALHLTLACVGEENTRIQNGVPSPIAYGVAVNVKTGQTFPAVFPDREPDINVRHACLYSSGEGREIYDCKNGILKIGPFDYTFFPDFELLLSLKDQVLLRYLSTSPLVEPPHFVQQTRSTLKFMMDNPDPYKTVFKNKKPHCFKRNEDCSAWVPVEL